MYDGLSSILLYSSRMGPQHHGFDSGQNKEKGQYLGCLTKKQLILISVAVGLVVLLIIITVPVVVLTKKSGTFFKVFTMKYSLPDLLDFALLVKIKCLTDVNALSLHYFQCAKASSDIVPTLCGTCFEHIIM